MNKALALMLNVDRAFSENKKGQRQGNLQLSSLVELEKQLSNSLYQDFEQLHLLLKEIEQANDSPENIQPELLTQTTCHE